MTGGRLHAIQQYIENETFLCTYGDGLADINLGSLLEFHNSHGKLATVTAVRPVTRFGALEIDSNNQVLSFSEALCGSSIVVEKHTLPFFQSPSCKESFALASNVIVRLNLFLAAVVHEIDLGSTANDIFVLVLPDDLCPFHDGGGVRKLL